MSDIWKTNDEANGGRWLCYQCKDGVHCRCIGVPCQCDCEYEPNGPDEFEGGDGI